jgi:hypothetical protein
MPVWVLSAYPAICLWSGNGDGNNGQGSSCNEQIAGPVTLNKKIGDYVQQVPPGIKINSQFDS